MYTSSAYRESDCWVVRNDQVPGAISQVARLDQAEEAQREAIAFVAEVPIESVSITVTATISTKIDRDVALALSLRAEAVEKELRAKAIRQKIARDLERDGYSLRDIGVVLAVSHQRVHQMLKKKNDLPQKATE